MCVCLNGSKESIGWESNPRRIYFLQSTTPVHYTPVKFGAVQEKSITIFPQTDYIIMTVANNNIMSNSANQNTNSIQQQQIVKPRCKGCGSAEIEYDSNQGNSFCVACGAVLEESVVVSEVSFVEQANGASALQGQFISADKGKVAAPTIFGKRRGFTTEEKNEGGATAESREATIAAGRRRLAQVAAALNLSEQYVEMASRWLILALQHQFTRGRKAGSVAAACLYIVCRQEKTPHMLLDFSDVLQTSVYELGGIFLRLVRLLNLEIPIVDPSFYVSRFAAKLEFGEKTQVVANLALRLVARMKRDWINTGRRPGGVCAAGLIIAARMHGFRRSNEEITRIVHICEATLVKRLQEFAATPSANLTPAEFEGVWLEQEADPPAFSRAIQKNIIATAVLPTPPSSLFVSPLVTPVLDKPNNNFLNPSEESATLSDFEDDEEVDASIMRNEEEISRKTEIWMALNKDYIDKLEKQASDTLEQQQAGAEKKPAKKRRTQAPTQSAAEKKVPETAAEAAKMALSTKRFSKKINYAALEELLNGSTSTAKQ